MTHEQNGPAKEAAVTNEDESRRLLQTQGYCPPGHYPWDYWEKRALAAGVPTQLASLGRAVMREAHQHAWSKRLQSLCGWNDRGGRMIRPPHSPAPVPISDRSGAAGEKAIS